MKKAGTVLLASVALLAVTGIAATTAGAKKKKPKPVTKTFTNDVGGQLGGVATTVPDGAGGLPQLVRSQITVKGVPKRGNIQDVNVGVRAGHTFDDDFEFYLVSPRGVIDLSSDNGGSGGGYGAGATSCAGTFTTFDSQAPALISTPGLAPFAGSFAPEESLNSLNGMGCKKVNNTTWTLLVSDDKPADTGTLFCWSLQIKMSNPR